MATARRPRFGATRESVSSRSTAGPSILAPVRPTKRARATRWEQSSICRSSLARLGPATEISSSRGLESLAKRIRPQLVIVSAGFDAHRDDPVGSLGLETEDFGPLTTAVLDVADAYAAGKIVSVLEGGYDTSALAGSVAVHLEELLKRGGPGGAG